MSPMAANRNENIDESLRSQNFSLFRDCLAGRVLLILSAGSDSLAGAVDSDDLTDFSEYLAAEALPENLQDLSHEPTKSSGVGVELDVDTISRDLILPPAFCDTLVSYALVPAEDADPDAPYAFLRTVLASYLPLATAPPPVWSSTRASECELCARAVPLTYHHLIPRSVHAKALKRGWHKAGALNSVAWLCRWVPRYSSELDRFLFYE